MLLECSSYYGLKANVADKIRKLTISTLSREQLMLITSSDFVCCFAFSFCFSCVLGKTQWEKLPELLRDIFISKLFHFILRPVVQFILKGDITTWQSTSHLQEKISSLLSRNVILSRSANGKYPWLFRFGIVFDEILERLELSLIHWRLGRLLNPWILFVQIISLAIRAREEMRSKIRSILQCNSYVDSVASFIILSSTNKE